MSTTLVLVLVVIGAYLATHLAFEWLARRYLVVSGAEYLLLGILLGPSVSGLIHPDVVGGFEPFMILALGWIGAVVGAQFHLPALVRIPATYFRVATLEAALSFGVVSAAMVATLVWIFPLTWGEAAFPAVALGAVATASAPSGIALVTRRLGRSEPVLRQLEVTTALDAALAIVAFGIILGVAREVPPLEVRAPTATEWVVISVAIGVVGGTLFHLFLGEERKIDRLFIALAGAVILASGAAAYLRLSPLLPTMLVGAILVNTSANREEIQEVLRRVERPIYYVLLVFAGAAWRPGEEGWLVVVGIFLVARTFAKLGGAPVAGVLGGGHPALGAGWGRALLGHGGLAIALALDYRLHEGVLLPHTIFTAAIVSVLLTDLSSAWLARSVVLQRDSAALRGQEPGPPTAIPEREV